jgi:hypothetical protein
MLLYIPIYECVPWVLQIVLVEPFDSGMSLGIKALFKEKFIDLCKTPSFKIKAKEFTVS